MGFDRAAALRRLADERFDVLVIGGGITGAGVALDAVTRGLRTGLVERKDLASGTSSKSSKLVHGGLRYLQQGEVRLVYEALAERQRLRNTAPHLVRLLPFLIPIMGKEGLVSPKLVRALSGALWMYDRVVEVQSQREYATFAALVPQDVARSAAPARRYEVTLPSGELRTCRSEGEFAALSDVYMEEN